MHDLTVQIVRFVDGGFPGWVECEFVDSEGRRHVIIEKVPMVTLKDLDSNSEYPTSGIVRCEVLERYQNERGQELVHVSTAMPWSIESTEGVSEFTVHAGLVIPVDD